MKREDVEREDVKREDVKGHTRRTFHVSRFKPAFTLLEMIVTIALIAVLATVVTVSFAGPRRAARAQDVAEELVDYDRLTREGCRRSGRPARLTFDLDRGTVRRTVSDDGNGAQPMGLKLSGSYRITRVMSPGRSDEAGQVALACSPRGQTPSYAVLLAGPDGERRWLVVAGLTGKTFSTNDAREVQSIFESLAGGDDAP